MRYYKVTVDKGLWFVSAAMRVKYGTYLGQTKDKTLNQKLARLVPPSLTSNQKHHNMKWQSISNSHSGPIQGVWVAEISQYHIKVIIILH